MPRLRDQHPSLWYATVTTAIVHTTIGVAFLVVAIPGSTVFLGPATSVLPFRAWGALSLALGIMGLSGVLFQINLVTHERILRAYHFLGVFMATCWAVSEAYALIQGNLGLVAAPMLWTWLGASHAIMAGEAPENPRMARRRG